ncbi:MAG: holo-ACP synthase [Spirochaetaceae bacterium]|nr:holo-ACP synthase [Spirochaetaceae bacterium]
MIKGLGIDICQVDRFNRHLTNQNFLKKIFSPGELAYCLNKADSAASFAARFAAKESLIKALAISKLKLELNVLEVAINDSGAPYWQINNELKLWLHTLSINKLHLSLSHEAGMAIAITIAEN